jgi:gliding motility-associated-like protein
MNIIVDTTNITCYGADNGQVEIRVTGGTRFMADPFYKFSIDSAVTWNDTTNNFITLAEDTFYIAVQDSLGCIQFDDTIEMLYPDTITIDAITVVNTTCSGGGVDGQIIISASGGASTLEYSLDGIAYKFGNTFTGLSICDTNVFVRDRCGFKQLDSTVSVTGPIPLIIDSATVVDVNTCFGENIGQITVYASGGDGVYTYLIDGVENVPATSNVFTNRGAGTYTLTVEDGGGCISPLPFERIINEPNELIITSYNVTHVSACNIPANTGEITINASGGTTTSPYQYAVTGYPLQAGNTFSNLNIGNYTITVQDANNCVVTLDTAIVLIPGLDINLIPTDVSCNGGTNGSITINISNGTPNYTYKWSNGAITSSLNNITAGVYTVTVTDQNVPTPCQDIASIEVFEPQALTIAPDIRHKRCIYSSSRNPSKSLGRIIVDVNGGTKPYLFDWTGPSGAEPDNDTIVNLHAGLYNLEVTDFRGCTRLLSATVNDDESSDITSFKVDFEDNSVCWNEDVRFTATYSDASIVDTIIMQAQTVRPSPPNFSEDWIFAVDRSPSPYYGSHPIEEKIILWTIRSINDYCQENAPRDTIDYFPDFELDIVPGFDNQSAEDTIYLKGENSGQLGTSFADYIDISNLTYLWTSDDIENKVSPTNEQFVIITPKESGFYNVVVESNDNCVDSSEVFVEFIPLIEPYTGFSPNGDGINEYWEIEHINKFPNNIVSVYNRWGMRVYEQVGYDNNDPSKSWDGNAKNGKELPSGTYYYIILLKEGNFQPISGSITIIR